MPFSSPPHNSQNKSNLMSGESQSSSSAEQLYVADLWPTYGMDPEDNDEPGDPFSKLEGMEANTRIKRSALKSLFSRESVPLPMMFRDKVENLLDEQVNDAMEINSKEQLSPSLADSINAVSDVAKVSSLLPNIPSSVQHADTSHSPKNASELPMKESDYEILSDELLMLDETTLHNESEVATEETNLPLPVSSPLPPSSSPPEPLETGSRPSCSSDTYALPEPNQGWAAKLISDFMTLGHDSSKVSPDDPMNQEKQNTQFNDINAANEHLNSFPSHIAPIPHADEPAPDDTLLNEDPMNDLAPINPPTEVMQTSDHASMPLLQEFTLQDDAPSSPMLHSPSPIRASSPFRPLDTALAASSPPSSPAKTNDHLDIFDERALSPMEKGQPPFDEPNPLPHRIPKRQSIELDSVDETKKRTNGSCNDEIPSKRQRISSVQNDIKPVNFARNKEQHSRLVAPFRSPLVKTSGSDNCPTVLESGVDRGATLSSTKTAHAPFKQSSFEHQMKLKHSFVDSKKKQASPSQTTTSATKTTPSHHQSMATLRAAKQFKSPVSTTSVGIDTPKNRKVSVVQLSPSIQALERRNQLLKRAIRIRKEEEEEKLEALLTKWTQAAREVALELWALVRDSTDASNCGNQSGVWGDEDEKDKTPSWGWDDDRSEEPARSMRKSQESEGVDDSDEDENEPRENNLGTMLRQLNIDPSTLGWNEEEEEFFD